MRRNRVLILFAVVFAMCTAVIWLGTVLAAAAIVNNNGLTVSEAGSANILSDTLKTEDSTAPGAVFTYTLVTTPANGFLRLNGTDLNPNDQFNQSDIDSSLLDYMHDDSETLSDSFDFIVESITDTLPQETFLITVTPVFDQIPLVSDQTFSVDENSSVGTAVDTIITTDSDAGDALTYGILDGNTGNAFEVGSISSTNGAITVANTAPLDHETNQSITFTVAVTDMGMLTDTAVITVSINDINEAPIITGTTFTVTENSAIGTPVGTVITSDVDINDSFTYGITASDPAAAFAIGSTSGQITVSDSGLLNFDTTPTFTLTVVVTDSGNLSDSAEYIINLENVDEPPVVIDSTFTPNENLPNGEPVGTINATDPENGTLTYTVTGGNTNSAFDVGINSGAITVSDTTQLNFEVTPIFTLTVDVDDGFNTAVPVTATIQLQNLNEAPMISDATFSLNENSSNSTLVGTIPANDPDTGESFTYDILSGNSSGAFAIDNNGNITVAASGQLDYETTPSFLLGIIVTDSGNLNNTANVTINLNNLFDENPVVSNSTFSVAQSSANGVVVGTVNATDPEFASGDTLTFSIIGGNSGTVFAINSSTGQITVPDTSKLDADAMPTFNLTVQAIDKGGQADTGTITINVTPLPTYYIYVPLLLNNYPPIEPNNNCNQSYGISSGRDYEFTADDVEDWYAITLTSSGNLTVILSSFEPAQGQLIVYGGSCGSLTLLGNNGTPNTPDKTLNLGTRPAGTYYIRVYSAPVTNTPYTLRVNIN